MSQAWGEFENLRRRVTNDGPNIPIVLEKGESFSGDFRTRGPFDGKLRPGFLNSHGQLPARVHQTPREMVLHVKHPSVLIGAENKIGPSRINRVSPVRALF